MPVLNTSTWDRSRFFLRLIFTVAAALLFFLMALAYKNMQRVAENNFWVNHSMIINVKLEKLYSDLKDIETERRNFLLTRDEASKTLVKNKIKEINTISSDLCKLFRDNRQQEKNLSQLTALIASKYNIVNESFKENIKITDPVLIKQNLLAGRKIMAEINVKINKLLSDEDILLNKRRSDFLVSEKFIPVYLYIIALFSLGLIGFSFFKMNGDLTRQFEINRKLQISADTSGLAEKVADFGTITLDLPTNTYRFSDNFYRILGHNPQEFPASYAEFSKHIHPDDLPQVNRKTDEILAGKNTVPFRFRAYRKDGSERIFEKIGKKIKDSHRQDIALAVLRDITNEEKYKTNLAQTNRELSFYNLSSKEAEKIGKYGFWRWNVKKNTFLFSDNIYKIFGAMQDASPETLATYLHPADRAAVQEQFDKFREGEGGLAPMTFRILRGDDGKLRHIRMTSKLMDAETDNEYYLMIAQDITDEIVDKHLIEEKNHFLEANNKELMAFNYVASHDLQEPLRKIETFISRIKEKDNDSLSDTGRQYMERISAAAGKMRNLITDLLQFSRTARADLSYTPTDLNGIFSAVKEEIHQVLEEKHTSITADPLPTLEAIPFQIQQLFHNLISNALKYSKDDTPLTIKITAETVPASEIPELRKKTAEIYHRITFTDNGIGFENEYADKIFELFHRLHTKNDYEGTGIGLAICKKITENHKGIIYAHGYPGQGAAFTICLPENM